MNKRKCRIKQKGKSNIGNWLKYYRHKNGSDLYLALLEEKRKAKKCYCGHSEIDHEEYIDNGKNKKNSRFVCTKNGCSNWNQCDL